MFCDKCGAKKINGKCPNCAASSLIVNVAYNVYVFVATIATLLIIRLITQETRSIATPNSWKSRYGTEYYVPGNIQGVMLILLCISAFILLKMYNSDKYSKVQTLIMLIAEVILGLLITFVKFS